MRAEQAYFLNILADYLQEKPSVPPADALDWTEVLTTANIHQLGGVLYYQCNEFLPEDVLSRLLPAFQATVYVFANRESEIANLTAVLKEENIPHFIIKGAQVARFYPVPALRTMGDTDIVVPAESMARVHEIMGEQGFVNQSCEKDHEWEYYKENVKVEIHDRLLFPERVNPTELENYFNNCWTYVRDGELDSSFHFLYVIAHLRKHLMNRGVGFRHFMDVAVYAKGCESLRWDWIREELSALGLLDFCETVFAVNERWFGVPSPMEKREIAEDFLAEATETVFRNGIFGFSNEESRRLPVLQANIAGENTFRRNFSDFFPPYSDMIAMPEYAFLKGRAILLPAAWIYRFGRSIAGKRAGEGIRRIQRKQAPKAEIEARADTLRQWGLMK